MQCPSCGFTDTEGHYLEGGACPECNERPYRFQPSPTQPEMHERNMPEPGADDMGGNPLQEGIWGQTDGGWKNRMNRDESFASVKRAEVSEMDRLRFGPRGPGGPVVHGEPPNKGWQPQWLNDPYGQNPRDPENYFQKPPVQDFAQDLMQGTEKDFTGDFGEWQPGSFGRGLIDGQGQVHTWGEEGGAHQSYMQKMGIDPNTVDQKTFFGISEQGEVTPYDGSLPEDAWTNVLANKNLSRPVEGQNWNFARYNPSTRRYHWLHEEPE